MRLGLGYQINRRFNTELAYQQVNVDKSGNHGFGVDAMKWMTLQVGINFGRAK